MRYLNQKTGAVIDSSFVISGGDWVLEGETPQVKKVDDTPEVIEEKEVVQEVPEVKEVVTPTTTGAGDAYDSITIPQIKQELDAFGIEYDKRANKKELYDLMMAQGK